MCRDIGGDDRPIEYSDDLLNIGIALFARIIPSACVWRRRLLLPVHRPLVETEMWAAIISVFVFSAEEKARIRQHRKQHAPLLKDCDQLRDEFQNLAKVTIKVR